MIQAQEAASAFYHNVEGITAQKLTPDYWLSKADNIDQVLLTPKQINALNQQQFEQQTYLHNPLAYPEKLTQLDLKRLIQAISKPSKYDRFYPDGTKLTPTHYQVYIDEMALAEIAPNPKIEFALVVKRAPLRMFPTLDRVLNADMDFDIDRFQETAVFPGEAVAILHTSKSGEWVFVQNYHYRAWMQSKYLAIGSKHEITKYKSSDNILVVTGDKVSTTYNPYQASVSEVQLDMGTKLPLISNSSYNAYELDGHNPYAGHIVKLPTRDKNGRLQYQPALIAKSADVNLGYLPMTRANIIKQSFKFLGERYGWGHDFNGRDCTGFVGEIYKTFGLLLPRNSGQQGNSSLGLNTRFDKTTSVGEKMPALKSLDVGDLIYLPGHVAMFLGNADDGKPFIIHDVHSMRYENSQGKTVKGILNGVSVTPLLPFKHYLSGIYNVKRIRK